jgi:hydrocephalus-inducing protein
MMYQSRVYDIRVTNTSQIRFDYQWELQESKNARLSGGGCPFSIMPSSGFISAGATKVFKVRFSPMEVDDFRAVYLLRIPFLSAMEPAIVQIFGFSRRPLCHFDIPLSDYISAGRRHPAYNDPLPDDVKVIELFASGIGAKTIKKFDIINPTSAAYEVRWKRLDKVIVNPIQCIVTLALVSSGKRYGIGFQYCPVSVKTIESLWLFSIPDYGVFIHFLIVGRIMPG